MVKTSHKEWNGELVRSEPALFVSLAERIPEWSVLVGLIGTGQEIHKGEEEGLRQWHDAIQSSRYPKEWHIHAPPDIANVFSGSTGRVVQEGVLSLDTELRYHLVASLHEFIESVLVTCSPKIARTIATKMYQGNPASPGGIRLWITREIDVAKKYLRERYAGDVMARYGLVASSKDKILEDGFGVHNSFQATKNKSRLGAWYTEGPESERSCTRLESVATEFDVQGLELDMALLAWGKDLIRVNGQWTNQFAAGYKKGGVKVKDPFQLRLNSYRVLLTRGRDGTVVFLPPLQEMDETWDYLVSCGFRTLKESVH